MLLLDTSIFPVDLGWYFEIEVPHTDLFRVGVGMRVASGVLHSG